MRLQAKQDRQPIILCKRRARHLPVLLDRDAPVKACLLLDGPVTRVVAVPPAAGYADLGWILPSAQKPDQTVVMCRAEHYTTAQLLLVDMGWSDACAL